MDGKKKLEELVAGLAGVTPGPWSPFIDDSGDEWTGWPLSISADSITDKTVVRPGGFYPYRWDTKTSQHEAVANAAHIARCDPDSIRSISDAFKAMEDENQRLREALTPSAWTKAAFWGEFFETVEMCNPDYDEDDEDSPESIVHRVPVSWTTIKAIMAAIRVRSLAQDTTGQEGGR